MSHNDIRTPLMCVPSACTENVTTGHCEVIICMQGRRGRDGGPGGFWWDLVALGTLSGTCCTRVFVVFFFRLVLCFAQQLRTGRSWRRWEQGCSGLDCPGQTLGDRSGKGWECKVCCSWGLGKGLQGEAWGRAVLALLLLHLHHLHKLGRGEMQPPKSPFPEKDSLVAAKESFTKLLSC